MTLSEYFGGEVPDKISIEDLDNYNRGKDRATIPWSEVAGGPNPGQRQQLKQQRHIGAQIASKPEEPEI